MNTYSDDGNFIFDARKNPYPVETAHPLPLPEGIELEQEDALGYPTVLNGPDLCGRWNQYPSIPATHWLARRPLPEVPKVKTQEELDREAREAFIKKEVSPSALIWRYEIELTWNTAIAYARQCPAKPAA